MINSGPALVLGRYLVGVMSGQGHIRESNGKPYTRSNVESSVHPTIIQRLTARKPGTVSCILEFSCLTHLMP